MRISKTHIGLGISNQHWTGQLGEAGDNGQTLGRAGTMSQLAKSRPIDVDSHLIAG